MKHKTKIQLRYNDSDQMGVVYHANYFTFFEQGRTDMLKFFGIDYYEIEKQGFIFPIRDVSCRYLRSIRLGEQIIVETEIKTLSKVRIDFEHKIYNQNNELKAIGETSIICVQKDSFTVARFDRDLPEVYRIKDKI